MKTMIDFTAYRISETDELWCAMTGLAVLRCSATDVVHDATEIATRVLKGEVDYNHLFGCFRFVIYDKQKDERYFIADNIGSLRFFVDEDEGHVSDRFMPLVTLRQSAKKPNALAIAQILSIQRIMDNTTFVTGINRSNPFQYFKLIGGKLLKCDKNIRPFSELDTTISLHELMGHYCTVLKSQGVAATITGGTDSRTILSHLLSLGCRPTLFITGHKDSKDIQIAQKIADQLELALHIYNAEHKEEGWLQKAIAFCDGEYDAVLAYRQLRQIQMVSNSGCKYKFGGCGGEFYKNYFYRPYRPSYVLFPATASWVYHQLIGRYTKNKPWQGDCIKDEMRRHRQEFVDIIAQPGAKSKLAYYNQAGFIMLSNTISQITNIIASHIIPIDPLMERNLIAGISARNPASLVQHRWQREQIHQYCPTLSDIETDQGYSCSMSKAILMKEKGKVLKALMHRISTKADRLIRKLGLKKKTAPAQDNAWATDYSEAKKSHEFREAVQVCKRLGIIATDAKEESLPTGLTGWIITIGEVLKSA